MSYHETSDADLNRHLAELDRGDSDKQWIDRRAEGYWSSASLIAEAWQRVTVRDIEYLFALDIVCAMTGHPDSREARAERLLSLIEDKIADEFIIMAGEELDSQEPDYD